MVDFLNPVTLEFIKDVGFPITLVLILLSALAYMVKKDEKRQTLSDERHENLMNNSDERYDKLLDRFISGIKDISEKHDAALKEISENLKNVSMSFNNIVNKLNDYMKEREQIASKVVSEINEVKEEIRNVKYCIEELHPGEYKNVVDMIETDKRRVPKEYR